MTGWTVSWWHWVLAAGTVLILAAALGVVLYALLAESACQRAFDAGVRGGQEQTVREYGLAPRLSPESWNPQGIPRSRDRADDHQMVTRTARGRETWPAFERR